jgi:nuclear pore complex protein Nup155
MIDGRPTAAAIRRSEAHDTVNKSDDELFQFDLYEWYLSQDWQDMLLAVNSHFVIEFLTQSAKDNVARADLLWRYYVTRESFYEAAVVQLELAKSDFAIPLARRVEYLSRAKANASAQSHGIGRQARQVLLYEVTELLDVANIQDELLHRLLADERVPAERKTSVAAALDGQILNLTEVFYGTSLILTLLTPFSSITNMLTKHPTSTFVSLSMKPPRTATKQISAPPGNHSSTPHIKKPSAIRARNNPTKRSSL